MQNNTEQLTVKYLINLLNDHVNIKIEKKTFLVDTYQILKLDTPVSYNTLLFALMIAYKNIKYNINDDYKIYVDKVLINNEKNIIHKTLFDSSIDIGKKKKELNFIINHTNNDEPATNESILMLTLYFNINLIIYTSKTQTIKCYYYDEFMDRNQPFIIIKETESDNSPHIYYEIVCSKNKYIFDFSEPIIMELLPNAFIVGLEQNKILKYQEDKKVTTIYQDYMINDISNITLDEIYYNKTNKIKIKLIPSHILKLIDELMNTNFEKMKIKK